MIFQVDLITLATLALLGLAALAALAVLLADGERLPRLVRTGMEEVLGAERCPEQAQGRELGLAEHLAFPGALQVEQIAHTLRTQYLVHAAAHQPR